MEETDWFPLTACPVREGVYKTIHLDGRRGRREGFSKWIMGRGWSLTEKTIEEADKHKYASAFQSKQWKGVLK